MAQTITSVEGPAANPLSPYRPTRIRPGRVTQQQISELWEGNSPAWAANYWERLDDVLHHLLGGTRFILPDEFLDGVLRADRQRTQKQDAPTQHLQPIRRSHLDEVAERPGRASKTLRSDAVGKKVTNYSRFAG